MTDGSPKVNIGVLGTFVAGVRAANIDGPKGYDPACWDPESKTGVAVEDEPVGGVVKDAAAGTSPFVDSCDKAEDDRAILSVLIDAGDGKLEDEV